MEKHFLHVEVTATQSHYILRCSRKSLYKLSILAMRKTLETYVLYSTQTQPKENITSIINLNCICITFFAATSKVKHLMFSAC